MIKNPLVAFPLCALQNADSVLPDVVQQLEGLSSAWQQQAGDAGELGAAAAKLFASIRRWVVERAGQTGEQGGAEGSMDGSRRVSTRASWELQLPSCLPASGGMMERGRAAAMSHACPVNLTTLLPSRSLVQCVGDG